MKTQNKLRCYYIPNSTIFITQVLADRAPILLNPPVIELMRQTLHNVKALYPFTMLAYVYLPDHLHLMFRPADGVTFSSIMHSFKSYVAHEYARGMPGEANARFWQKRFYDHVIRSESDFADHLDYIHYNPCRHGYVTRPEDWQHSSFRYWHERDVYSIGWGWNLPETLATIDRSFGEP